MTVPAGLGPFSFGSGYSANGIRLTNPENAPQGVPPRLYPYCSIVNQHAGQDFLWVIVGRVAQRPLLLKVDKARGTVTSDRILPTEGEAEGWFFSDRWPSVFFYLEGPALRRYDVRDGRDEAVFTLEARYGDDLWQVHNSADDTVHSATVRRRTADGPYEALGCVVVQGGVQRFFSRRPADPKDFDECIIDKSGRWLIIQEERYNRIIDLSSPGVLQGTTIEQEEGALGHLDVGDGFMVGEDDSGDRWQMTRWDLAERRRTVVLIGPAEWGQGLGHLAVRAPIILHSSNATGELWTLPTDGSSPPRVIAPGLLAVDPSMTNDEKYDRQLRACLDPAREYAAFVSNLGVPRGRFDLFLAQLPGGEPPIIVRPPDPKPPPGGGSAVTIPLAIFTTPEAESVRMDHDDIGEIVGTRGEADGRPAHVLALPATLEEGHGAWLVMTWANGAVLKQHGGVFLKIGQHAVFAADIFEQPPF